MSRLPAAGSGGLSQVYPHNVERRDLFILLRLVVGALDGVGPLGVFAGGRVIVEAVVAEELGWTLDAEPPLTESFAESHRFLP